MSIEVASSSLATTDAPIDRENVCLTTKNRTDIQNGLSVNLVSAKSAQNGTNNEEKSDFT